MFHKLVRAAAPRTALSGAAPWSPVVASAAFQIQTLHGRPPARALGIMSTIQDKMDDKSKSQQIQQFKDQVVKMTEGPIYSLESWNDELGEAMDSWRMKVPGAKSQPEVQKMIVFREIIAKMTSTQKANPNALIRNKAAMATLAADAGKTPQDVQNMLLRFDALTQYQEWVKKRKASGLRMPKTMEEMQMLVQTDLQKKKMSQAKARTRRF